MEKLKYRNELKYVCHEEQLRQIENRIKEICEPDIHAGADGMYTIRSVYFDDYYNTCFYENENGTDPREKFRIRIYNADTDYITLECKRKQKGLNHKFSCPLTRKQCEEILDGSFTQRSFMTGSFSKEQSTLLNKFRILYDTRLLRPKVIVEYERTPYVYDLGNVRITFDRNISGCKNTEEFLEPEMLTRAVMPSGKHILEVKYDEFLPDYIHGMLQIGGLLLTAYSKYYICRKYV